LIAAAKSSPEGRITIVGTGAGAVDDLTFRAVRALQSADVIVCDELAAEDILELARREARRLSVPGGDRSRPSEIGETMLALARQGNHVVRVRPGDPSNSRAGDETAAARAAGFVVEFVPGISSGRGPCKGDLHQRQRDRGPSTSLRAVSRL
jgi:uroporphyrin-III C-methyltransferase/precorrin-2 dehydrogenase/sirohydrochlorin ferrochelatase